MLIKIASTWEGIQAAKGALGMSLQTPRALSAADAELLLQTSGAEGISAPGPTNLTAHQADPTLLVFEVTEGLLLDNLERPIQRMQTLAARGVRASGVNDGCEERRTNPSCVVAQVPHTPSQSELGPSRWNAAHRSAIARATRVSASAASACRRAPMFSPAAVPVAPPPPPPPPPGHPGPPPPPPPPDRTLLPSTTLFRSWSGCRRRRRRRLRGCSWCRRRGR